MDLYRIIRELVQERDRLQRIIESLEEVKPSEESPRPLEGKRRGRKSMQQQDDRRIRRPGFTIKDVQSVDFGRAMMCDGRDMGRRRAA